MWLTSSGQIVTIEYRGPRLAAASIAACMPLDHRDGQIVPKVGDPVVATGVHEEGVRPGLFGTQSGLEVASLRSL